jgi:phosphoribosylglycinamide formyltransferase-1
MTDQRRPAIAIFASGRGSTFRAVADAIHEGLVDFDIVLVITDRPKAGVLDHVAEVNRLYGFTIQAEIINKKRYPGGPQERGQTLEEAAATTKALKDHKIDHYVLMGCLRINGKQVVEEYGWKPEYAKADPEYHGIYRARMTNTHPGILPATHDTYGIHTQEKALALGLTETAHTFQAVAVDVDEGPVIAEHRVRIYPDTDTPEKLFDRVQRVEKAYLPLDIDAFLKDQARYT